MTAAKNAIANRALPINIVLTWMVSQTVLKIGFTGPKHIGNMEEISTKNVENGVTKAPKILSLNLRKNNIYTRTMHQEKKEREDLKSNTGAVPRRQYPYTRKAV
jgi:hypothetical protein